MKVLSLALYLVVAVPAAAFMVQPSTSTTRSTPRSGLHQLSAAAAAAAESTDEAEKLETLLVSPITSLDGTVTLPGSKSLSNRCLLLAALSEGNTR
eukprot:CAMPEP_0119019318 /NCGR_PEP_ID=MMETSP1176-20130426/21501_1 /TAXON_ID=265551 /ORGANISM="Synedropsis recta cf, Strain CCMP1620" /LENGTH=95 /DNA_ID=CAMNT_0006973483 /DNA_START=40 /DNA_END=324 /DNA_ORIENTATION=+